MRTNPAQGQQSPYASGGSGTAAPQGGRKQDGPRTCVYSGRLQKYGKSKRSGAPADGHRSDSPGIFYKFPAQRSSGSVREALRLSRPTGLLNVKIFSYFCRCPPYTHVRGPSCIRPPLGAAVPEPPDIAWALLTLRRVLAFVRFFPKSLPQIF